MWHWAEVSMLSITLSTIMHTTFKHFNGQKCELFINADEFFPSRIAEVVEGHNSYSKLCYPGGLQMFLAILFHAHRSMTMGNV